MNEPTCKHTLGPGQIWTGVSTPVYGCPFCRVNRLEAEVADLRAKSIEAAYSRGYYDATTRNPPTNRTRGEEETRRETSRLIDFAEEHWANTGNGAAIADHLHVLQNQLDGTRAKLATAEALVGKIQDAIRDTCHLDPEHQIKSHADSLPDAYRAAAADLERVAAICNEAVLRANPELAT